MKCPMCGFCNNVPRHEINRRIKIGIANSDKVIGRPATNPHDKIIELRKRGMSYGKIAIKLKINRSAVHYALKRKRQ